MGPLSRRETPGAKCPANQRPVPQKRRLLLHRCESLNKNETRDSCHNDYEECRLLRCDTSYSGIYILTFHKNLIPASSTILMIEAAGSSERSVLFEQTTKLLYYAFISQVQTPSQGRRISYSGLQHAPRPPQSAFRMQHRRVQLPP